MLLRKLDYSRCNKAVAFSIGMNALFTQKAGIVALFDERLLEGSIVITSNRPPGDWFSIFPDAIVGGALLDRLVSNAVKLIVTSGRSLRKEGVLKSFTSAPAVA